MNHLHTTDSYNSLLDVRDASKIAHSDFGKTVLHSLLAEISRSGLQDSVGVRLLHKHNDLRDGEIMMERLYFDEDGVYLETTAECGDLNSSPNSWKFIGDDLVPIEFSDSSLLLERENDCHFVKLFDDLRGILHASGLSNILGPCIHYSKKVDHLKPTETSAFLEKTDPERRSNILRYVERESIDFSASVETKWRAQLVMGGDGKRTWLTACTCFCSVSEYGGHLGTKTHRYDP